MSIFTISVYPLLQAKDNALSLPLARRFGSAPYSDEWSRKTTREYIKRACSHIWIIHRSSTVLTFWSRNSTTAICPCAAAHIRGVKPSSSWRLITVSLRMIYNKIKHCNHYIWFHQHPSLQDCSWQLVRLMNFCNINIAIKIPLLFLFITLCLQNMLSGCPTLSIITIFFQMIRVVELKWLPD